MTYIWKVLMMRAFYMHDQRSNKIRDMQIINNNHEEIVEI